MMVTNEAVPIFKVPQKVQHDKFGVGQIIAYDSDSRKYTIEFGQNPIIRRRMDGSELAGCDDVSEITPMSLAEWLADA